MESSRQPVGIFKGRYADHRAKHHSVRCSNIEPYLEDSDTDESMLRYTISKQTLRSKQRERTQLKRLGTDVGTTED